VQAGDPRADPSVVDLVELAGLWLAGGDLAALERTLLRLNAELVQRYPAELTYAARFQRLTELVQRARAGEAHPPTTEELRRTYRRAIVG
jgi:hypothetical protein